jgi:multiple sugar transport system substrate-binding protein
MRSRRSKRGQRLTAALALALAGSLTLTACGGGSDPGGEAKQTVTMWVYPVIADDANHKTFWAEATQAFTAANPKIEVKVEVFPWANRDQALATAIAGNKAPDVVYLIPDQLPKYANSIEPADSYLDAAAKADYLPNVVKSVTIDGKMMGAPILTSALALICNSKVFAEVGQTTYPSTWAEMLAMAPAFKAKGYDVASHFGDPKNTLNTTFYPLLWQAGGDVFSPDGKSVAFNSEAGKKAVNFLKQLVDGGYVDKSLLTSTPSLEQTRLAQNKVGCIWNYTPTDVEKFWGKQNIKVLPPLKETTSMQYGTVGSLVMLKQTKVKAAAGKWISFATAAETAKKYDTKSGFFGARKSVGALYTGDPVLGELEKYVGTTTVGPLHPKARDVMGVLAPEIQAALLGKKSVEQALADAAKAAAPLLG